MNYSEISAVVTGATSGLGAATASALADRGATVIGIDLPSAVDRGTSQEGVRYVAADVTSEEEVTAILPAVEDTLRPLQIVVNCAGIAPAQRTLSSRGPHDLETFRGALHVNLLGTFNVMRLFADVMAKTEVDSTGQRGVIINTASIAAYEGQGGQVAYAASKAGVVGMTLPAARDLARFGIRVNTIAPGVVETPMLASLDETATSDLTSNIPFPKRLARPEEFARLVTMIVEHDYLNGETIRMDAALRMSA